MSAPTTKQAYLVVDTLGTSPIPSAVLGTSLILKGLTQPNASLQAGVKNPVLLKPTRLSCFGFGAANLLGTWMMIDGEPINASGFNFAWSALYVIVNGKPSISALVHGRFSALALSGLALGNATIYGLKFFWPGSSGSNLVDKF
jgi:hypothetical protein